MAPQHNQQRSLLPLLRSPPLGVSRSPGQKPCRPQARPRTRQSLQPNPVPGRRCPMSAAAVVILPHVWAVAARKAKPKKKLKPKRKKPVIPEIAFYRKYTEALLRRYLKLSMEYGRAPSLLGREMFRGNVTHY